MLTSRDGNLPTRSSARDARKRLGAAPRSWCWTRCRSTRSSGPPPARTISGTSDVIAALLPLVAPDLRSSVQHNAWRCTGSCVAVNRIRQSDATCSYTGRSLSPCAQVDGRRADALTAQQGRQQHRRQRALQASPAAAGELFDLVESKDSDWKDAQQGVGSDGGQAVQNRWQKGARVRATLAKLKRHEESLVGKNTPRKEDVHYQALVHGERETDREDDPGTAPEHLSPEARQLSRQNAFKKDGRRQDKLVEKAREAYDATGGGLAGMQVTASSTCAHCHALSPCCTENNGSRVQLSGCQSTSITLRTADMSQWLSEVDNFRQL